MAGKGLAGKGNRRLWTALSIQMKAAAGHIYARGWWRRGALFLAPEHCGRARASCRVGTGSLGQRLWGGTIDQQARPDLSLAKRTFV